MFILIFKSSVPIILVKFCIFQQQLKVVIFRLRLAQFGTVQNSVKSVSVPLLDKTAFGAI